MDCAPEGGGFVARISRISNIPFGLWIMRLHLKAAILLLALVSEVHFGFDVKFFWRTDVGHFEFKDFGFIGNQRLAANSRSDDLIAGWDFETDINCPIRIR